MNKIINSQFYIKYVTAHLTKYLRVHIPGNIALIVADALQNV